MKKSPPILGEHVPYLLCWTRRVPESLTMSRFSALKGQASVSECSPGQALGASPWVEIPFEFAPLPRLEVPGFKKMASQSGGEGKGEWGSLARWERTPTPPVPRRPFALHFQSCHSCSMRDPQFGVTHQNPEKAMANYGQWFLHSSRAIASAISSVVAAPPMS